jgi:hypothetical protein
MQIKKPFAKPMSETLAPHRQGPNSVPAKCGANSIYFSTSMVTAWVNGKLVPVTTTLYLVGCAELTHPCITIPKLPARARIRIANILFRRKRQQSGRPKKPMPASAVMNPYVDFAGSSAAEFCPDIVSCVVLTVVEFGVTEAGENVQVYPAGSPEQAKVMG